MNVKIFNGLKLGIGQKNIKESPYYYLLVENHLYYGLEYEVRVCFRILTIAFLLQRFHTKNTTIGAN